MRRITLILVGLLALGLAAFGQENTTTENSFIINYIEQKLSTESRQIRLSGVEGVLSSNATIKTITVSDTEGIWLQIDNASIDWNRRVLLLGRIEVNTLTAENISVFRHPVAATNLPTPEARSFSIPDLPVSIRIGDLAVDEVAFDESIFGLAAVLGIEGRMLLDGGSLDTALTMARVDGPGGAFVFNADYDKPAQTLDLEVTLDEPQRGIVSRLLKIDGDPALLLDLRGAGPLSELDLQLVLDADGKRLVEGNLALRGAGTERSFSSEIAGDIQPLIPAPFRPFFADKSRIAATGATRPGGGVLVSQLAVESAALKINGSFSTAADGFLDALRLTGNLGASEGFRTILPVPGGRTSIQSAALQIDYGGAERWTGSIMLDSLAAGSVSFGQTELRLGGISKNLDDPATRQITAFIDGKATGVTADDPALAAAVGERIDLFVDTAWSAGSPLLLRQAQISGNGLSLFAAGAFRGLVFSGRSAANIADIAPLSEMSGRSLSGGIRFAATGEYGLFDGRFDMELDGTATDLALSDPNIDPLLLGTTVLTGRVARDERGLSTDHFKLSNPQLELTTSGRLSSLDTDMSLEGRLADVGLISERASGAVTLSASVQGEARPYAVSVAIGMPEGQLVGRELLTGRLGFEGQTDKVGEIEGQLTGTARLDGALVSLNGVLALVDDRREFRDFRFTTTGTRMFGDLSRDTDGIYTGAFEVVAPQVRTAAVLLLTEASGAVEASIKLARVGAGQTVTATGKINDLQASGARVIRATFDAAVDDLFGVPLIDGSLDARGVFAAGLEISKLSATATRGEGRMDFVADAALANGSVGDLAGNLTRLQPGLRVELNKFELSQGAFAARLTAPGILTQTGDQTLLTPFRFVIGSGYLTASGGLSDHYDLDFEMQDVPLAAINLIRDDLGITGLAEGRAHVSGPPDAPALGFNLRIDGFTALPLVAAGLPPLSLNALGSTNAAVLTLAAGLTAQNGLDARLSGDIPMSAAGGDMALDLKLQAFPLALLDPLSRNQGLSGSATGQATITGKLRHPRAEFEVAASNVGASRIREYGFGSLSASMRGSYAVGRVTLEDALITGADQLSLRGSGTVPLTGAGLDVSATGSVPLKLANLPLAHRASQASGMMQLAARVRGSLTTPSFSGSARLRDGTMADPLNHIRINDVSLDASLDGRSLVISALEGKFQGGGRLSAGGRITIDASRNFPADLDLQLHDAFYSDGRLLKTIMNGQLSMRGPLTGAGKLSGQIDFGKMEISIPDKFGINEGALLDVVHRGAPPAVRMTLERAEFGRPAASKGGRAGRIALDILLNAPNQVFVRGRGVDAELGGSVRIIGRLDEPVPVGRFTLRRGRLNLLGQRVDFDEGSVILIGDLDPRLRFVARTQSEDVSIIVVIDGPVSEPEITFSSIPPLPSDEVLARLIFNRRTEQLSTLQLAELAAALATLTGKGGTGFIDKFRTGVGLDNLDIVSDDDGGIGFVAGKYIRENIYLDIEVEADGDNRASVNLDISDNLTAKGTVGSDGDTSLGIFYQRDY